MILQLEYVDTSLESNKLVHSGRVQKFPSRFRMQAFSPELYEIYFGYPGGIHDTASYHEFDVYNYDFDYGGHDYGNHDYGSQYIEDYGNPEHQAGNYSNPDYDYHTSNHQDSGAMSPGHDYECTEGETHSGIGSDNQSDNGTSDYDYTEVWYSEYTSHPIITSEQPVLITPNVLRAAREHFNCSELTGVPLEEDSIAHLDQRVFQVRTCSHRIAVIVFSCICMYEVGCCELIVSTLGVGCHGASPRYAHCTRIFELLPALARFPPGY